KDHFISNLKIKKGTLISIPTPALHRSPYYYSEPEKFIPDRYLNNNLFPNDRWRTEPFIFQAFHSGPRNCIGQNLALMEARLVLGLTILRYHIEYPKELRLKMNQEFLYSPHEPLVATLMPRTIDEQI